MKKQVLFTVIAAAAVCGVFANPKGPEKQNEKIPAPEFKMPEEALVKEYHNVQLNSLKILKEGQVKAGICNQEEAEASIANLKAVQSRCRGMCIVQKRTDMPFGRPDGRGEFRPGRPDCKKGAGLRTPEGKKGPGARQPKEKKGKDGSKKPLPPEQKAK